MPFTQPKQEEIDLMRYLPTAGGSARDSVWLKVLAEEADAKRHFAESVERYVRATAMTLALAHIREFGMHYGGAVKR